MAEGMRAMRRAYYDAEMATAGQFSPRLAEYRLLASYAQNDVFEDAASWASYAGKYKLYSSIRSIYNPTGRLVNFYTGQVYPGVLPIGTARLPETARVAVPLGDDTTEPLREAIGQFWQWSNWQTNMGVMVRYGATLGDAFVEVVDDVERGKVAARVLWPGFVTDLTLDDQGNVQAYRIAYDAVDEKGERFRFAKAVDRERIVKYRDDTVESEEENPYTFVPAVWVKHEDLGGDHGQPAIRCGFGKLDELNSLASHIHDQVHKVIEAPFIIWSKGRLVTQSGQDIATLTPAELRRSLSGLIGPDGGGVSMLLGDLSLGDALATMEKLIGEIEQDHPELGTFTELRSMSAITGPAAERLLGDVATLVGRAAANYDQASIKLFQQAVAIGGYRANSGDWGPSLTRAQEKFKPFNLDSYARGDLDFSIEPRALVPATSSEKWQAEQARAATVQAYVTAGFPLEIAMRMGDFDEDDIASITKDRMEAIDREQALATEDVIPTVQQ